MTPQERNDFSAECNRRRDEGLVLIGKTFSIKESIKEAGGIWDGGKKAWLMPDRQTLTHFEVQLGLPVSYDLRAPTNRETVEAIVAAPTVEAAADGALAKALEEAEMVIEARETELADIRFRLEALATVLSACTKEQSFGLCRKVATALTKMAYADKE